MPAVGPDGKVYIAWIDQDNVKVAVSANGGEGFGGTQMGPSVLFAQSVTLGLYRLKSIPSLAIAPNGNLCLSYAEGFSNVDQTRTRVRYTQSSDAGSSWSTPYTVWEPGTGDNYEYFPATAVDRNGDVFVAFEYATKGSNDTANTFIAVSTDGGSSFDLLQNMSSGIAVNSNGDGGGDDFMGMVTTNAGKASVVWTDHRDGEYNIYYANTEPNPPALSSPSNCASVSSSPTLSWNAYTGGSFTYRLQIALNSMFTSVVLDTAGLTTSSYQPSNLNPSTNYYWRVNATNLGFTGEWSSGQSFHIRPTPQPNLIATYFHHDHLGELAYSPQLNWSDSAWCGISFNLYKYSCTQRYGCPDTVGTQLYSGTNTTYNDSSWYCGTDSTQEVKYYVMADDYSKSNIVTYGRMDYSKIVSAGSEGSGTATPKDIELQGNYPNPFNPTTEIRYTLPVDTRVSLEVFNVLGQKVATLVDGIETAGYKSVTFDATNLPSGIYFYRFHAGDKYVSVKKMLILK